MSKLKSKEELAAHAAAFPNVSDKRKEQIVEHLTTMPADRHDAVHAALADDMPDTDEGKFIVGCFTPPPAPQDRISPEHPGFKPAA